MTRKDFEAALIPQIEMAMPFRHVPRDLLIDVLCTACDLVVDEMLERLRPVLSVDMLIDLGRVSPAHPRAFPRTKEGAEALANGPRRA